MGVCSPDHRFPIPTAEQRYAIGLLETVWLTGEAVKVEDTEGG